MIENGIKSATNKLLKKVEEDNIIDYNIFSQKNKTLYRN